jgi:hypothetical protein
MLTTIAWRLGDEPVEYALEGAIFITGAAVQWLRDGLGIIKSAEETEELAASLDSNDDVYFVPALVGLGAPHWDSYARGTLIGITRGTDRAHLARAALESMCYQTRDAVEAMAADSGIDIPTFKADGGTRNARDHGSWRSLPRGTRGRVLGGPGRAQEQVEAEAPLRAQDERGGARAPLRAVEGGRRAGQGLGPGGRRVAAGLRETNTERKT